MCPRHRWINNDTVHGQYLTFINSLLSHSSSSSAPSGWIQPNDETIAPNGKVNKRESISFREEE